MDVRLAKEIAKCIEGKRLALDWEGEVEAKVDEMGWLAPGEWRTVGAVEDDFDLYVDFGHMPCIDGDLPETFVGQLVGFSGAYFRLLLETNALGKAKWKALLRSEHALIGELADLGFMCDAKAGDLGFNIVVEKGDLADAFENGDFQAAIAPVERALERVRAAKPILDRLVTAIRQQA